MAPDADREIADEVTRLDAVRYLQGASGHAVGSSLFLLVGGLLWAAGHGILGGISVVNAFLLSANGLSIWAWDRLQAYFEARAADTEEAGPTRTLTVKPFSDDSLVEMKAGAVMALTFVGLLGLGRLGLYLFDPWFVAALSVGCLGLGNLAALAYAYSRN